MTQVYVCHKCNGLLETLGEATEELKFLPICQCISGYVREWQEPIDLTQALRNRAVHSNMLLQLYQEQKRHPNDQTVIQERKINEQLRQFLKE